ncbi:MAG: IS30 family transposase, partial [Desulfovibrio piger]|nr:IS30 family transposase [Desulfovibrio piger]
RALNEQSNGLLRQFFPRRRDFSRLTNEEIARAVALINHRPRKKFGYLPTVEQLREKGILLAVQFI